MSPQVTVIVPVHNSAPFLEAAITSIRDQTLADIEIICVDDGSTDTSSQILGALAAADDRISVLTQPNQGPGAARNLALAAARGEYLYFFDSDDLLDRHALERLTARARADDLDIVYFDAEAFGDPHIFGDAIDRYTSYYTRAVVGPEVRSGQEYFRQVYSLGSWVVSPCLQLIKASWLQDLGLVFPEGGLHEDNLFSTHAALHAPRVAHLPEPLFRRRVRPDSIMTSPKTFTHVRGLMYCAHQLSELVDSGVVEPSTVPGLRSFVKSLHRFAITTLGQLDVSTSHLIDHFTLQAWEVELLTIYDLALEAGRHAERTPAPPAPPSLGSRLLRRRRQSGPV